MNSQNGQNLQQLNSSEQNRQNVNEIQNVQKAKQFKTQTIVSDIQDQDSIKIHSVKEHPNKLVSNQNLINYLKFLSNNSQNKSLNILKNYENTQFPRQKTIIKKVQKQLSQLQTTQRLKLQNKILQSKRFVKLNFFTKDLLIHQISASKAYEIVKLQIQFLWYKTQILILNQVLKSPLHGCSHISGSGAFGNVYFCSIFNENSAVKCINFNKEEKQQNQISGVSWKVFINAIKEYFYILMFSELQIGPQAKKICGFDLILSQNCIEFATQICLYNKYTQKLETQIKRNLFIMHMFQIVHRDIKPSNIMFSQKFKKPVFIDFGCTEALYETLGQKTLTKFAGTTKYCTEEVLGLLTRKKGIVDLYFNDLYSLELSFTEKQLMNTQVLQVCFDSCDPVQNLINKVNIIYYEVILMKYYLLDHDYQHFEMIWKLSKKRYGESFQFQQIQEKILDFFSEIKPNEYLRNFYWREISQTLKDYQKYRQFRNNFKDHTYFIFGIVSCQRKYQSQFSHIDFMYRRLEIQYSNYSSKQKQLQLILICPQNIENYIESVQKRIQHKNQQNQCTFQEEDFIKFCLVVAYYSAIDSCQFHIQIKDKIQACDRALTVIEKLRPNYLSSLKYTFKGTIPYLLPVVIFFHYFIFNIWHYIPQKYKPRLMINSISTFCLLGYPAQQLSARMYLNFHFSTNQPQINFIQSKYMEPQQKLDKIVIWWESNLVFHSFRRVFYDPHSTKFSLPYGKQDKQGLFKEINEHQHNLMIPIKGQLAQFFMINFKIYIKFVNIVNKLYQNIYSQLMDQLNDPWLQNIVKSDIKIRKWLNIVSLFLSNYFQSYQIDKNNEIKVFNFEYDSEYKNTIYPYTLYLSYFSNNDFRTQLYQILTKIDHAINCQQISLRVSVQLRLDILLQRRQYIKLREIFRIFKQEVNLNQFYSHNFCFFGRILHLLFEFMNNSLLKQVQLNKNSLQLFDQCFSIFKFCIEVCEIFTVKKNLVTLFNNLNSKQLNAIDVIDFLSDVSQIRDYFYYLINISHLYIQINEIQASKINEKRRKNSGFDRRFILPEKHKILLQNLEDQQMIFDFTHWLIGQISKRENLKQMIKDNKSLRIQFYQFIINYRKNLQQIYQSETIFQDLFQDFINLEFQEQDFEKINSLIISVDYIQIKIIRSNFDLYWCQKLIQIYNIFKRRNRVFELLTKKGMIRFMVNCFFMCQKPYCELEQFLRNVTLAIKKNPSQFFIQKVNLQFLSLFWCKCITCFPVIPQNLDFYAFTEYLAQKIRFQQTEQNPYMSLVYAHNLVQKKLKPDIIKKFTLFIVNSVPFLSFCAKRLIIPTIYYFSHIAFPKRVLKHKLHYCEQDNKKGQTQIDQKPNDRKLIYYYFKYKKNQIFQICELNDVISDLFEKEVIFRGYKYPYKIKIMYTKKLKRYFEVKQNFYKSLQHSHLPLERDMVSRY